MPFIQNFFWTLIPIPISAFILWVIIRLFKLKENKFLTALKIAVTVGIVMFIVGQLLIWALKKSSGILFIFLLTPVFSLIINTMAVKLSYKLGLEKAALIGLIWMAIDGLVNSFIVMIVGKIKL